MEYMRDTSYGYCVRDVSERRDMRMGGEQVLSITHTCAIMRGCTQRIVHYFQCTLYRGKCVQCTVYDVLCTLYTVQYTLYIVHGRLIMFIQCVVHCTMSVYDVHMCIYVCIYICVYMCVYIVVYNNLLYQVCTARRLLCIYTLHHTPCTRYHYHTNISLV